MNYKKISSSTDDIFGGRQVRIHRVLLAGGSDASSIVLYDDATASGSTKDFCKLHNASANSEKEQDWGSDGLTVSYVSATLTGTGAILYLYYA